MSQSYRSHPVWVRGLKLIRIGYIVHVMESHPVWVRGLKLIIINDVRIAIDVAPRVGAWIETMNRALFREHQPSHPVWVRGLKLDRRDDGYIGGCRTPCGCVD